jgi:hypothetical protein
MDLNTGRPNHIEDYLVQLHLGQWFGWSDSKNKVYANLIIHDSSKSKPTEQECIDGLEQLKFDNAMLELREQRNNLLAQTDWVVLPDSPVADKTAWETYRTQLRDITNGLTTVEEVIAVVFPTKPN